MTSCSRWVRVCVDMLDHPSLKGPYDRRSAWLWLISNAAWKDHKTRTRAGIIEVKRGEVIGGLEFLANTWGWSVKKVRTFLGELAAEGMIEKGQAKNQYASVLTICNYDAYQNVPEKEASEKATEGQARGTREASEGQDSTRDTNNTKDNNIPSSVTTVEQEAAREPAADAKPKFDYQGFRDELFAAANGSLNRACGGLEVLSEPMGWLENGADLEKDVLPVVKALGLKAPPASINSWAYFRNAVAQAKERRARGLPAVDLPSAKPSAKILSHPARTFDPNGDEAQAIARSFVQ